jgi:hypothetical protein
MGDTPHQCLALKHQIPIVGFGAIPLKHGEFWKVARSALFGAPASAKLEDPLVAGGEETFHAEFGGCVKEPRTGRDGVDLRFRGRGGNKKRGIHFKIPLSGKKCSDCLQDDGTGVEVRLAPGESPVY